MLVGLGHSGFNAFLSLDVGPLDGQIHAFGFGDLHPPCAVVDVLGSTGGNGRISRGILDPAQVPLLRALQTVTGSDVVDDMAGDLAADSGLQ